MPLPLIQYCSRKFSIWLFHQSFVFWNPEPAAELGTLSSAWLGQSSCRTIVAGSGMLRILSSLLLAMETTFNWIPRDAPQSVLRNVAKDTLRASRLFWLTLIGKVMVITKRTKARAPSHQLSFRLARRAFPQCFYNVSQVENISFSMS